MVTTGITVPSIASISLVPDSSESELPVFEWPELDEKALYGLAGDVVRAGAYTNVEPAGLLISFLTAVSSCLPNTGLHLGDDYYPTRLFSVLVGGGPSTKSAFDHAKKFFAVDGEQKSRRSKRTSLVIDDWPLEVGDDFINKVVQKPDQHNPEETLHVVPEASNTHLLVKVSDFGSTLYAAQHLRNRLAAMLRGAYDDDRLKLLTQNRERIEGLKINISLLGEIAMEDLRTILPKQARLRGLVSRILWVALRPSNTFNKADTQTPNNQLIESLSTLIATVIQSRTSKLAFNQKSKAVWGDLRQQLIFQQAPGISAIVGEKAETQILRLSGIYAVLDETGTVLPEHLEAAMAVWQFCKASSQLVFGENKTGLVARKIIAALSKGEKTQSELRRDVFGDHLRAEIINNVLTQLQAQGLVLASHSDVPAGRGRPATIWKLGPGFSYDVFFGGGTL